MQGLREPELVTQRRLVWGVVIFVMLITAGWLLWATIPSRGLSGPETQSSTQTTAPVSLSRPAGLSTDTELSLSERLSDLKARLKPGPDGLPESPADKAALEDLAQSIAREHRAGTASFEVMRDLALVMWWSQQDRNAQEWAARAYDAALGTEESRKQADAELLHDVAEMMAAVGLTSGKPREHTEFTAALTAAAEDGRLLPGPGDGPVLAEMLGSKSARQSVRRAFETQEVPSPVLGEILSHAYRNAEQIQEWTKWVTQRADRAGADDETFWLLIRGHAESARFTPFDPARRYAWIQKALKAAGEDSARVAAIQELARYYWDKERPEMALRAIDEYAGQITQKDCRESLERLRLRATSEVTHKRKRVNERRRLHAAARERADATVILSE